MTRDPKLAQVENTRTIVPERLVGPTSRGVRVTVLAGPDAGQQVVLANARAIVGRSAGCDLRLSDPTVSAFHAELSAVEERTGIQVSDLSSRNGTQYAGARLEKAIVPSGATLEVGSSIVRVELDAAFETQIADLHAFGELRGRNVAMRELFSTLQRLARTELSVLIEGQTGTGKELAARGLHDTSPYGNGPFVVLDCTAIPSTLAESVLFGHERGAFTGANERRAGIFEAAEGGTVFLDEVGELPLELQPKLLRVLERREVVRVGSTTPRPVQVRVVCATWRDLRQMINQGRFREDLYYRLAQARVTIPPLRERNDDIALLVYHFLQRLPPNTQGARAISQEALGELQRREYAGNVRELKSTVERAAMMAEGAVITGADLAFERMLSGERARAPSPAQSAPVSAPMGDRGSMTPADPSGPLQPFKEAKRTLIDEFEKDYLQRLLHRTGDNLSRAAALAGIERHYLRDLFRKHGLRSDE
ncbi:MAG: sigma 54-dependent Fis family transcriptional regulator [Myxococcales bacterium]|nr:sigma 54-dependent Fis family transcriptional regulator [Myxococcales bacterium]